MAKDNLDKFLNEGIYQKVLRLQTQVLDHPWSKRITNKDADQVSQIYKNLVAVGNLLYLAREELLSREVSDEEAK